MSVKLEHVEILDNGVVLYDSGLAQFTQEEVDEKNRKYYEHEASFIPKILEDGYIEFPILWDNGPEPIWSSCYLPPEFTPSCSEDFEERFGMKYNIYIPSYKRAGITYTDKMLDRFGIENYYICIDPSQYPEYSKYHDRKHLIIRDPSFKSEEKLDLESSVIIEDTKHGASGVFNSLLYISKSVGEECYFTMDDDIFGMGMKAYKYDEPAPADYVYRKEDFYRCSNLTQEFGFDMKGYLKDMMDIFVKFRNVSFMSAEKFGLVFMLPIHMKMGTRSYSFYLTNNKTQCDHLGHQNNDTITSLEMAKRGYVNAIFEGINYCSLETQRISGGATGTYQALGTLDKTKVLAQSQPNYSKISVVYSRIHHTVDYNSYNKARMVGAPKQS